MHGLLYKFCALVLNEVVDKFWGVLPRRVSFLNQVYGLPIEKIGFLNLGAEEDWMDLAGNVELIKKYKIKYGLNLDKKILVTGGKIDLFKKDTLILMRQFARADAEGLLVIFGSIDLELVDEFNSILNSSNKIIYLGWLNSSEVYEVLLLSDLGIFLGRHSVLWEQCVGVGLPLLLNADESFSYLNHNNNIISDDKSATQLISQALDLFVNNDLLSEYKKRAMQNSRYEFSYSRISERGIHL